MRKNPLQITSDHFRMALIQYYKNFDLQSFFMMVALLLLLCENENILVLCHSF